MHTRIALLAGLTGVALSLGAGAALAGPCTDQIAELGKTLSQSPALGPVTTGALGGSNPGNVQTTTDRPGAPSTVGTSADNRVGGSAGTKEINAAVGNLVATSSQDIRRQQEGLPTAAAQAASKDKQSVETAPQLGSGQQPSDNISMAKMELERARMLDQSNDQACMGCIDKTRQLIKGRAWA